MNKVTAVFSIFLLSSGLVHAEEVLPPVEKAEVVQHECCSEIPGKVLHYEEGDFDWTGWAADYDTVLFAQDNADAIEAAQAAGLTVGTIERFGVQLTIVVLDTDAKEAINSWLAKN